MVAGDQVVRSKESVRSSGFSTAAQRRPALAAPDTTKCQSRGQQRRQPDIDLDVSIRAPSAPMAESCSRSYARARVFTEKREWKGNDRLSKGLRGPPLVATDESQTGLTKHRLWA